MLSTFSGPFTSRNAVLARKLLPEIVPFTLPFCNLICSMSSVQTGCTGAFVPATEFVSILLLLVSAGCRRGCDLLLLLPPLSPALGMVGCLSGSVLSRTSYRAAICPTSPPSASAASFWRLTLKFVCQLSTALPPKNSPGGSSTAQSAMIVIFFALLPCGTIDPCPKLYARAECAPCAAAGI